jgi:hypothetical protein
VFLWNASIAAFVPIPLASGANFHTSNPPTSPPMDATIGIIQIRAIGATGVWGPPSPAGRGTSYPAAQLRAIEAMASEAARKTRAPAAAPSPMRIPMRPHLRA